MTASPSGIAPDVGKRVGVGHDRALSDVGIAVRAVGREQGGRLPYLRFGSRPRNRARMIPPCEKSRELFLYIVTQRVALVNKRGCGSPDHVSDVQRCPIRRPRSRETSRASVPGWVGLAVPNSRRFAEPQPPGAVVSHCGALRRSANTAGRTGRPSPRPAPCAGTALHTGPHARRPSPRRRSGARGRYGWRSARDVPPSSS